jgi:hypothetical protein
MNNNSFQRRRFIKSSAWGLFGISTFNVAAANNLIHQRWPATDKDPLFYRYPSMNDGMVSSIVGLSHRDFDKVKALLEQRPELAVAAWDWGFGDWETALGAASHVGRRDIAELLMSHGARPDIFTFAMLGAYKSLQEIVETVPGIQSKPGPHGITLLQHAKNRLTDKTISTEDKTNVTKVISYLESIGNADLKAKSLDISEEEKQKYVGEYRFGDGDGEIFVVDLTSQKALKVGRKGSFGNMLKKIDEHTFTPTGAPSVRIIFKVTGDKAVSFAIHEPEPLVAAIRI